MGFLRWDHRNWGRLAAPIVFESDISMSHSNLYSLYLFSVRTSRIVLWKFSGLSVRGAEPNSLSQIDYTRPTRLHQNGFPHSKAGHPFLQDVRLSFVIDCCGQLQRLTFYRARGQSFHDLLLHQEIENHDRNDAQEKRREGLIVRYSIF